MKIGKEKRGVLKAEGMNLTHLWCCWWSEEKYCGERRDGRSGLLEAIIPRIEENVLEKRW